MNRSTASAALPSPAPAWRWPLAYLLTMVTFLAMDAVWLSTASARLYQPNIGHLMAAQIDWRAVAVFYPLYVVGLVFFAVAPALTPAHTSAHKSAQTPASRRGPARLAFMRGAFFGFLAYATYDFTNQATLRDWPWLITAIDLVWGTIVSGVSSGLGAMVTAAVTSRRVTRTTGQ